MTQQVQPPQTGDFAGEMEEGHGTAAQLSSPVETDEKGQHPVNDWKPSTHELLIMISLAIISFMISLDATVIVTALSTIVLDLHGTATQGFWVGTSYLLTCGVFMPTMASFSEIFGRSPCLLASIILFTVGSIVCATANSFTGLFAGRSVQGIGGGGAIILSLLIFTDMVPLRYRPKYYGIIQGAWACGTIIGPLIGGAISQHTTWRWLFYLMLPLCGVGFVSTAWLLTFRIRETTFRQKLARVDWLGSFLFISSSISFLIAISWGGTEEPWTSFRTIVPLIFGFLGLIGTVIWELFGAAEPFLRRSLFNSPSSIAAYAGALVQGLLLWGSLYFLPFYFIAVKESSPVRAGVCMLPIFFTVVPASVVVGALITRLNRFRWAVWLGWAFATLGHGLTIIWGIDTSTATWAVILVVLGFGHGLLLNAQNFTTQAVCKRYDEATAAAMYMFLRSFGMALGVGIGSSIFQNAMRHELRHFGLPDEIAAHSESYVAILKTLPNGSINKTQILEAYVHGFRAVYGTFCGLAGAAGITSLVIKHADMNKKLETEHKLQEYGWSRRPVGDTE